MQVGDLVRGEINRQIGVVTKLAPSNNLAKVYWDKLEAKFF